MMAHTHLMSTSAIGHGFLYWHYHAYMRAIDVEPMTFFSTVVLFIGDRLGLTWENGVLSLTFHLIALSAALLFGSLLPDIDSETSTLGRYVKPIARAIPHRTFTHTLWVVLVLGVVSVFVDNGYLYMLTLGYTLHIVEDSFSRQGICWLYPIVGTYRQYGNGAVIKSKRNPKFFFYRTNKTSEWVVFSFFLAMHFYFITLYI